MTNPMLCRVAVVQGGGNVLTYGMGALPGKTDFTGRRVSVPLGKTNTIGIIVEQNTDSPFTKETDKNFVIRNITDVLDDFALIPPDILRLTRWIAEYYICDWIDALRAALPPGLIAAPKLNVRWIGSEFEGEWNHEILKSKALLKLARIVAGIRNGSINKIASLYGRKGLTGNLKILESHELVSITEKAGINLGKSHTVEIIKLNPDADIDVIPSRLKARIRLLEHLYRAGGELDWGVLRKTARVERHILKPLIQEGYVTTEHVPKKLKIDGFDPRETDEVHKLTDEQDLAVNSVIESSVSGGYHSFLLTGPPGSGKTRVYTEIIKHEIEQERGVILLVPEISLTPQVVSRIKKEISSNVAVLHSGLSQTERLAAWRHVRNGSAKVIIGPRSAVFAPMENLGLIVVDEEHEESFKQSDPPPRYNARETAMVRAKQNGARVLLCSGTPSLESIRLTKTGDIKRLTLSKRFGAGWPLIKIADRRRESGAAPYIGSELTREIESRLELDEGIVLLISRRGYSPVLVCRDCGERIMCPDCAISLTLHYGTETGRLRCHLCGFSRSVPATCESCDSTKLSAKGAGTQRIEEEIQRRFPQLSPMRMDSDATKKAGVYKEILRSFASGDTQLLVGTQMVAKGHDFGHVTLVGVINADPVLFQPDFRASERTFRLLVQAAGRAGRGKNPGVVVIQTLDPEHALFQSLAEPDIDGFLQRELEFRNSFYYPPFARMAVITLASEDEEKVTEYADIAASAFRNIGKPIIIIGPAPAMIKRVKRKFRSRIIVRTKRGDDPSGIKLRTAIRKVSQAIEIPPKVSWIVDIDPVTVA
ncbi:MAG: primosomal protein N' [Candidatus Electryonea clarkiae]|nr:primosomal protein N' [Candidatus Electryonea clarkiae]MDP8286453.1 primosomal protein N' [Candidatus Electryonea clarkiae]